MTVDGRTATSQLQPRPQVDPTAHDLHPHLRALLARLTLSDDGTPDADSWQRFVSRIDAKYREADRLETDAADAPRRQSSFENLFRISPIPLIEQDYTVLEGWMDELRSRGVTDLREYLGPDIEAVRAIVPMIRVVAANPAAIGAVGLPAAELVGPINPTIVNEGAHEAWLRQLDAVWNRRPVCKSSFTAATAGGRTYDAESILAAPSVDGEPDFSHALLTIIDVTAHRDEERRMQELVEVKNRFLASVSHEIRTPLTAVLGFAEILNERDLSEDDRRLMVASIAQQARDVAGIIDDLLVASRSDAGHVEIATELIDVADLVHSTLNAGGSFTTDVVVAEGPDLPMAVGDPTRVRQVLRNLLTNAKKYGGPDVSVCMWAAADTVTISVRDNGIGLPRPAWERIFELYHRAHESSGTTESVGIGLAISRQLAELMNGTLDYVHEEGLSRFRLTLPAAQS